MRLQIQFNLVQLILVLSLATDKCHVDNEQSIAVSVVLLLLQNKDENRILSLKVILPVFLLSLTLSKVCVS